jgi:uncharacterized protein (DUF305 family)
VTRRRILGFVGGGVLLLAIGLILGRLLAPTVTATPSTDSAAAGFLRDMRVHHAQAVEMALLVRDRTDDPEVRQIAYDIAVTQANQSGAMYGLLEAWDLPQFSSRPAMAWTLLPTVDGSDDEHQMDADAPAMPGMATSEQIAELTAAQGDDAVRMFLTLMIAHHQGGVEMADAALARTEVPQVVSMATGIQRSQSAEIIVMRGLLDALPAAD